MHEQCFSSTWASNSVLSSKVILHNHILLAKPFGGFDVFVTYVSSGMFMLYSDNKFETLLTQSPCDGEFFSS